MIAGSFRRAGRCSSVGSCMSCFISVAVVVAVTLACGGDSIRLLWLSIIRLVLFMQL